MTFVKAHALLIIAVLVVALFYFWAQARFWNASAVGRQLRPGETWWTVALEGTPFAALGGSRLPTTN